MKISRQDLLKVGFSTAIVGIAGVACSEDAGRASVTENTGGGGNQTGGATGSGGAKTGGATGSGGAKSGGATGSGGAKSGGAPNTSGGASNTSGGASNTSGGASNTSGGASQGSGGSQGTGMCASEPVIMVGGGHEHPVMVPIADVNAGAEKMYTLDMGDEAHTHMMTVTAANFTTLKTTGTVTVTSTNDGGHTHDVTLMCEGGGGGGSGGAVDNGSGGAPVDEE